MSAHFSRRDFIKTTGAVVAGATLLNAAPVQAGEFTGKIKKAVKLNMVKGDDMSTLDKFKLVKDLGFDGIEPSVGEKIAPEELKAASEESGLPIHGVVNGSVNDIQGAVDRALLYGSNSVLLVAGRVGDNMSYADNYKETQLLIRRAIPYAEEKKIQLLVENVWNNFLLSPLEMARYLDELDSPIIGAYFDIGNVVRFGWPEHWIPVLGKHIKKLDVKEYSRDKQNNEGLWKGFNVDIGDGSINWAAVRKELKAIDYSGWATAEVGAGGREHLADVAKRMDTVLGLV